MIITINGTETTDLNLKLTGYKIGNPAKRTSKIKVPGRHGELDLSNWITEVPIFDNRKLQFTFDLHKNHREDAIGFLNLLNGTEVEIATMPNWTYKGLLTVTENRINNYFSEITLDVDAYPFMLKNHTTVISYAVSTLEYITIYNEQMSCTPTIHISAAGSMSIQSGTQSFTLNAGEHILHEIVLKQGTNDFKVSGTGTITFTYQEGKI